jgi:hypothetical protein
MVQLGARRVERWSDGLLDGAVVLLATWTISYHLCLVLRLGTTWAVVLTAVLVAASTLLLRRLQDAEADALPATGIPVAPRLTSAAGWATGPGWATVAVGAAVIAAAGMAFDGPWLLVWLPWLAAAAAGAMWALASQSPDPHGPLPVDPPSRESATAALVLVWAVAMAVLSLWVEKSNPDDVFYLNLSQWVADHGAFPLRDTLFSNDVYPMANWPPVASYDALVGTLAHLTGGYAASIAYQVVTPIASALSVLALWRLLRAWRVRSVAVALSVALVFLIQTGDVSYAAPGNLFVTRLWQGKVILLCLLVPLLLVHALRYLERPSGPRLIRLAVAGIAAVGLSTTAIFLTPAVALAGMAPLALRSPRKAVAGFAAMAAYPLGAGVVTLAVGGHSADDFGIRRLYRFDASWIGHAIFQTGPLACVAVIPVLLGPLLLTHRGARVTAAVSALVAGLVLVPGFVRVTYDVLGLGPTLWRLSWGLAVAALVGVAVDRGGVLLSTSPWPRRAGPRTRRWVAPAAGLVVVGLLAWIGRPPWSSGMDAHALAPFHWQRPPASRTMASDVLAVTRPGDMILAPEALSITLAISSTGVWTVAPRAYYLTYLRGEPGFHERARRALSHFANKEGRQDLAAVRRGLHLLRVDVACVSTDYRGRYRWLRRLGFTSFARSTTYDCLQRP